MRTEFRIDIVELQIFKRLPLLSIFLLSALLQGSCRTHDWSQATRRYPFSSCEKGISFPSKPSCLTQIVVEDGFRYRGEFLACRQSIQNFAEALERWKRCELKGLSAEVAQISAEIMSVLECHEKNVEGPQLNCPKIRMYWIKIGEVYYAPPDCLDDRFALTFSKTDISSCRKEVMNLLDDLEFGVDEHEEVLQQMIQNEIDDAIRVFECKARRDKLCL